MANKTMKTLTIGGVTYEIVDAAARADIAALSGGVSSGSGSNAIIVKVPVLQEGETDYTFEDRSAIQTAINEISEAEKPVVILDYNGSYLPANYFCNGTHHYFAAIATDKVVDESGELYLIYIDYDTSATSLVVQYDIPVGGSGNDVSIEETTPEDIIAWMCEDGAIIPMTASNGAVYTTNDNKILIL